MTGAAEGKGFPSLNPGNCVLGLSAGIRVELLSCLGHHAHQEPGSECDEEAEGTGWAYTGV